MGTRSKEVGGTREVRRPLSGVKPLQKSNTNIRPEVAPKLSVVSSELNNVSQLVSLNHETNQFESLGITLYETEVGERRREVRSESLPINQIPKPHPTASQVQRKGDSYKGKPVQIESSLSDLSASIISKEEIFEVVNKIGGKYANEIDLLNPEEQDAFVKKVQSEAIELKKRDERHEGLEMAISKYENDLNQRVVMDLSTQRALLDNVVEATVFDQYTGIGSSFVLEAIDTLNLLAPDDIEPSILIVADCAEHVWNKIGGRYFTLADKGYANTGDLENLVSRFNSVEDLTREASTSVFEVQKGLLSYTNRLSQIRSEINDSASLQTQFVQSVIARRELPSNPVYKKIVLDLFKENQWYLIGNENIRKKDVKVEVRVNEVLSKKETSLREEVGPSATLPLYFATCNFLAQDFLRNGSKEMKVMKEDFAKALLAVRDFYRNDPTKLSLCYEALSNFSKDSSKENGEVTEESLINFFNTFVPNPLKKMGNRNRKAPPFSNKASKKLTTSSKVITINERNDWNPLKNPNEAGKVGRLLASASARDAQYLLAEAAPANWFLKNVIARFLITEGIMGSSVNIANALDRGIGPDNEFLYLPFSALITMFLASREIPGGQWKVNDPLSRDSSIFRRSGFYHIKGIEGDYDQIGPENNKYFIKKSDTGEAYFPTSKLELDPLFGSLVDRDDNLFNIKLKRVAKGEELEIVDPRNYIVQAKVETDTDKKFKDITLSNLLKGRYRFRLNPNNPNNYQIKDSKKGIWIDLDPINSSHLSNLTSISSRSRKRNNKVSVEIDESGLIKVKPYGGEIKVTTFATDPTLPYGIGNISCEIKGKKGRIFDNELEQLVLQKYSHRSVKNDKLDISLTEPNTTTASSIYDLSKRRKEPISLRQMVNQNGDFDTYIKTSLGYKEGLKYVKIAYVNGKLTLLHSNASSNEIINSGSALERFLALMGQKDLTRDVLGADQSPTLLYELPKEEMIRNLSLNDVLKRRASPTSPAEFFSHEIADDVSNPDPGCTIKNGKVIRAVLNTNGGTYDSDCERGNIVDIFIEGKGGTRTNVKHTQIPSEGFVYATNMENGASLDGRSPSFPKIESTNPNIVVSMSTKEETISVNVPVNMGTELNPIMEERIYNITRKRYVIGKINPTDKKPGLKVDTEKGGQFGGVGELIYRVLQGPLAFGIDKNTSVYAEKRASSPAMQQSYDRIIKNGKVINNEGKLRSGLYGSNLNRALELIALGILSLPTVGVTELPFVNIPIPGAELFIAGALGNLIFKPDIETVRQTIYEGSSVPGHFGVAFRTGLAALTPVPWFKETWQKSKGIVKKAELFGAIGVSLIVVGFIADSDVTKSVGSALSGVESVPILGPYIDFYTGAPIGKSLPKDRISVTVPLVDAVVLQTGQTASEKRALNILAPEVDNATHIPPSTVPIVSSMPSSATGLDQIKNDQTSPYKGVLKILESKKEDTFISDELSRLKSDKENVIKECFQYLVKTRDPQDSSFFITSTEGIPNDQVANIINTYLISLGRSDGTSTSKSNSALIVMLDSNFTSQNTDIQAIIDKIKKKSATITSNDIGKLVENGILNK